MLLGDLSKGLAIPNGVGGINLGEEEVEPRSDGYDISVQYGRSFSPKSTTAELEDFSDELLPDASDLSSYFSKKKYDIAEY
eukprot:TRINITY_DN2336_c0_g1_i1.p1 TRINITY_DN2336_c0_g1~~TRINITY_DN2336_c0_g1_i1.p1  ORF type:complete len:81 (+),score=18.62 TRINITY_DN2336_c0_g1_i1:28-270(+)